MFTAMSSSEDMYWVGDKVRRLEDRTAAKVHRGVPASSDQLKGHQVRKLTLPGVTTSNYLQIPRATPILCSFYYITQDRYQY